MKAKQARRLQRYVDWLAAEMGLSEWQITVDTTPADDDNLASILIPRNQQAGTIRVCDGFHGLPMRLRRETICHELVHCHLDHIAAGLSSIEHVAGNAAWAVFSEQCEQNLELAVDNIAVAWIRSIDDRSHRHLLR